MVPISRGGCTAVDPPWPLRAPPLFSDPWISEASNGAVLFNLKSPIETRLSAKSFAAAREFDRRRLLPPAGRIAKRKSRATRKEVTMFIVADPANFRQMVQQVTGIESDQKSIAQTAVESVTAFQVDSPAISPPMKDSGEVAAAAATRNYFDSFSSFPTLESWKAV
ncbi:hypothetical protein M569_08603 [Genlisea aurea]|uniref:VQ domain-containing protein n=1 Tax=Genlisea aurea TaxID=192259 RepID=S8CGS3_9LAMI|nr:hypothetical protein M569_08603 [Genlisea aurea]